MSAVNDGSCSPWVMCSCSVVSGNQIRDRCKQTAERDQEWCDVHLKMTQRSHVLLICFRMYISGEHV